MEVRLTRQDVYGALEVDVRAWSVSKNALANPEVIKEIAEAAVDRFHAQLRGTPLLSDLASGSIMTEDKFTHDCMVIEVSAKLIPHGDMGISASRRRTSDFTTRLVDLLVDYVVQATDDASSTFTGSLRQLVAV